MVRLIMGTKGSGKTKQLIELINNAAKDEPGNVVCIEANRNLTYDIHYHIRLIDAAGVQAEQLRYVPRLHQRSVRRQL